MGYSLKPRPGRGGARPGAGQPPFEPTKEQRRMVSILAGMGRPHKEIATHRPAAHKNIGKVFRDRSLGEVVKTRIYNFRTLQYRDRIRAAIV